MFEQSVLRPARVRGWAVTVGFMGELVAVACILMIPMIWPQLLPRVATMTWLTAPVPPPAPAIRPIRARPAQPIRPYRDIFLSPVSVRLPSPRTVEALPDAAPPFEVIGGVDTSQDTTEIRNLLNTAGPIPPNRPPTQPPPSKPKPTPAETKAVRVSGAVEAALLVHRVDPVYPKIAQIARVSGTVELNGIVGTDGHIKELRVASGNPLLAPAALDAVRQWVYRPTLLGGEPVEVITTITVIFRLN